MKIHINDIVTVRKDLVVGESYGIFEFKSQMIPALGKQFKVIENNVYGLNCLSLEPIDEDDENLGSALLFSFTHEMIEIQTQSTAVDWLIHQLTEVERNLTNKTYLHYTNNSLAGIQLKKIFEQAKEIEKNQIMNALVDGRSQYRDKNIVSADKYYNETFGDK